MDDDDHLFIYFVAENRQKRRYFIHLFVAQQVILVLINLLITFFYKKYQIIHWFQGFIQNFHDSLNFFFSKYDDKFDTLFNVKINFNYVFMELGIRTIG